MGMDLLGRLGAVIGISLVLTLLLLVLYQDDSAQNQGPANLTQASASSTAGAP
jgi:hypothetical protein